MAQKTSVKAPNTDHVNLSTKTLDIFCPANHSAVCTSSPLPGFLVFLPSNILLQDHVAAGQDAPQSSLRPQQQAAVRMLLTGPLQQVLQRECKEILQVKSVCKKVDVLRIVVSTLPS